MKVCVDGKVKSSVEKADLDLPVVNMASGQSPDSSRQTLNQQMKFFQVT